MAMRSTHAMGAAATMLAVLAAAGCSGASSGGGASSTASPPTKGIASGEPTPPQTSTASSSPASKSPTATPTSKSTAAGAPGVPEPARQHTKAGAKAFATYYFDLVNVLYRDPKSGNLKGLEADGCKICKSTDAEMRRMAASGQKYDRDQIKYAISRQVLTPDDGANVFLTMKQQPAKLLAADGTVVSTTPTPFVKSIAVLSWQNGNGWRVQDVANE